jgi:hypothetical protein
MRNNFRFIFPRLIGATVIVGLAALIITTIFKLLLGLVLIGGVVVLVKRFAGRSGGMSENEEYGSMHPVSLGAMNYHHYGANQASVRAVPVQKHTTIVPIN